MLSEPTHRADWYPDPTGRFEFRYHNGHAWTGDVSLDGNRFLDPLWSSRAAIGQPLIQPGPARGPRTARATAAFVLALASVVTGWVPFLCFLAIVAAILALIFAVGFLRAQRPVIAAGDRHPKGRAHALAAVLLVPVGLAASGIGIWLTVASVRAINRYTDVGQYSVATTSCSASDGLASFVGSITNQSGGVHSYHVIIEFDRAGTSDLVKTAATDIDDVAPNEVRPFHVAAVTSTENVTCSVFTVSGPVPFTLTT